MTSPIAFAPIALQLARSVSLDELFPNGAIEAVIREQSAASDEPAMAAEVATFFAHYLTCARAATLLLSAPPFAGLARFHDEVEAEYMPGGPPQSPVYDSFSMQFVLSSVPQGMANETPYSVLARMLLRDPSRARLQSMAQSLADSRLELCRVKSASDHVADIEFVRGGAAATVQLTGPFLRAGDFGLMRVMRFEDRFFVADSPYLLQASEEDWLQHLDRIVAQQQGPANASTPVKSNPGKSSKLSSKEQARRRQKDKARASRYEPEEIINHYLKFGLSPRYWFDYVMDAYAGDRRGIVFVAGVPDRPELLPHSTEYEGEPEQNLPPAAELRQALLRSAMKEGLIDLALREVRRLGVSSNPEAVEPSPNERNLLAAYATLGLRAEDGTTVLTRFERSSQAKSLRPDARAFIESVHNGWFSVFRVDGIHLDRGLEMFDLLKGQKLQVGERAATRQLAVGDLLLGWLCKDGAGALTLEGGLAHLPALVAPSLLPLVSALRDALPPVSDEQEWKRTAADLTLPLVAGILELRENPPLPQLLNTSGDPFEPATGHYRIIDHARVVATLRREFVENGDGSYSWLDAADTLLARFELSPRNLRAQVNSRKRLKAVQDRLEGLLGDAVERSLEVHEDIEHSLRARPKKSGKASSNSQPLELPPELAAQFHQVVLSKIRSTLDEPIPQFKGKTLRQLARSPKGRPDAISWLREQERMLRGNPQLAGIDLGPLWQELALPFQGLDTDPPL